MCEGKRSAASSSAHISSAFRHYFDCISRAFDQVLFKHGKRPTVKCNATENHTTPLSRHNLIHYDYLIQLFHYIYGGEDCHRAFQASFFHPLLKTPQVMSRLNKMTEQLFISLGWKKHFRPLWLQEGPNDSDPWLTHLVDVYLDEPSSIDSDDITEDWLFMEDDESDCTEDSYCDVGG
jgi:hypothetical protein